MEIRLTTNYFNVFRNINRYSTQQNKINNKNTADENSSKKIKSPGKPFFPSYPAVFYMPVSFQGIRLKDHKEEIIELHQQGKTHKDIAEIIGCSNDS